MEREAATERLKKKDFTKVPPQANELPMGSPSRLPPYPQRAFTQTRGKGEPGKGPPPPAANQQKTVKKREKYSRVSSQEET